jgi:hypothetical protein
MGPTVCVERQYGITILHSQKSKDLQQRCFRIMQRSVVGTVLSGQGPQPVPLDSVSALPQQANHPDGTDSATHYPVPSHWHSYLAI